MGKSNSSSNFKIRGRFKAHKKFVMSENDTPEAAEIRNRGYEKIMELVDRFK